MNYFERFRKGSITSDNDIGLQFLF